MNGTGHVIVEVTLLETGGPIFTVGVPRLFCRFSAAHLPGTQIDDGTISVVARADATDAWHEFTRRTTADEARAVIAQLQALGVPGRTPDAAGIDDTSDVAKHLFIRVKTEQAATVIDIGMQCSGFGGADAQSLQSLCRYLFDLAGFEGYDASLYGLRTSSQFQ